jgi:hypothetical protein
MMIGIFLKRVGCLENGSFIKVVPDYLQSYRQTFGETTWH